jgi:hypothetical protein
MYGSLAETTAKVEEWPEANEFPKLEKKLAVDILIPLTELVCNFVT